MLKRLSEQNSTSQIIAQRVKILLRLSELSVNLSKLSKELGHDRKTVRLWHLRALQANDLWNEKLQSCLNEPGHAGAELRKLRLAEMLLSDLPRCGAPPTYTPEQYTQIIALALTSPDEHGIIATEWSARELTDVIHQKGIAPDISQRQVKRFLDEADLRPHKCKYWLNPKIEDQTVYEQEVKTVCDCYLQAQELSKEGVHVISTDEKTGIQALERIAPSKPMIPGIPERIEFEYTRHGTLCLIPSFEVATGQIISYHLDAQRTEDDFATHIRTTVLTAPDDQWIFIADQLNTHKSEELVRLIAEMTGYTGDLGKKGHSGILENMKTRAEFITDKSHRIRFVYTPKHNSWLNQVEIWFGILSRKILRRGNFSSLEKMNQRIREFIDFFNRTMAKPFKWTYTGIPLKV